MGDCGSQALGYLLGLTALEHVVESPPRSVGMGLLAAVLFTSVPLFELAFITTVRIRKGLPWWKGSPDHFALRLQEAGFSKLQVNLLAAGVSLGAWLGGLVVARAGGAWAALVMVVLAASTAFCWKLLLSWEVKPL